MAHCPNREELKARVWVVYNILLEYNCRTEYESTITSLAKQYQEQVNIITKDMKDQISELNSEVDKLKHKLSEIESKNRKLEMERNSFIVKNQDLVTDLENTMLLHEKEVVMRLKFEAKISNMQAV